MKMKSRTHKATTSEVHARLAMQDNAHLHSVVVAKHRALAQFELQQCEESIVSLTASLINERRKRQEHVGRIEGMAAVLSSRAV